MKATTNRRPGIAPKGDRLNWTPLKQAKQVSLSIVSVDGVPLTAADLAKTAHAHGRRLNYFIP